MRNLTGKTEKGDTVGAFDKAGNVGTICILLRDVDPTAKKMYRSEQKLVLLFRILTIVVKYGVTRIKRLPNAYTYYKKG